MNWPALAICLAPLAASGLLFAVTGIRPRPLYLLALQTPPFIVIALIESLWSAQNLPRTVARVLAPAALLLIATTLIASSGSSTAALAFFALPYYTSAVALAGYGLVALLDRALRPLIRGARWAVIWIVALAVGASPPVYVVVQDQRQAGEWRRAIEQETATLQSQAKPLAQVWMAPGAWGSVSVHRASGTIVAMDDRRRLVRFDARGAETGSSTPAGEFPPAGRVPIDAAQLDTDSAPEVVVQLGTWADSVLVFDDDGSFLWRYTSGDAVNDMCVADLDGDGLDEIIAAYNGGGGVHAVSQGRLLWADRSATNVHSPDTGDLSGDGAVEVIFPGKGTLLHRVDGQGASLPPLDAGQPALALAVVPATGDDGAAVLVNGYGDGPYVCLEGTGQRRWAVPFERWMTEMAPSPDGRWIALGSQSGGVTVVDTASGAVVGLVVPELAVHDVAWASEPGGGLIFIVATDHGLFAFGAP